MNKEQILYEDHDIIVCYKSAGIATQTAKIGQPDMVSGVINYLSSSKGNTADDANKISDKKSTKTASYVGLVHRLDQPVEGILVFGKNQKASGILSRQITENRMEKYYYAVVNAGKLSRQQDTKLEGTLIDYLYKDGKTNTSCITAKEKEGAKRAELSYKVLKRIAIEDAGGTEAALVEIKLVTGRHHQIRVQMSHAGMSLFGDYKYADEQTKKASDLLRQKQVALCAYKLCFDHPVTGKRLVFQKEPTGYIFQKFFE